MNKSFSLILTGSLLLLLSCTSTSEPDTNFTQYVNPFVGTDLAGHTFPGAIVPFGMIQVSPDTNLDGWSSCSAYHYSDSTVYGFSHTHLSGTGCGDYADVLLMPFVGKPSVLNTEYLSRFSHSNETASPGYYAVTLDKNNVKVELTAGKRVGLQRYTFPADAAAKGVILDLKHRDMVLYSMMEFDAAGNSVSGIRNSKAWSSNQLLSFSILFSQTIQKIEFYVDDQLVKTGDIAKIEGTNCKVAIFFADDVKEITLKVAISSNTEEPKAAMKNLAEVADFDFDKVKTAADAAWNAELGKITVQGSDITQKQNFYTSLYHTFTSPYLFNDVDGKYLGQDGKVHQAEPQQDVYTVFSLWDTYRALHPLLNLIDHKRTEDFLYTFMKHYEQGGMLTVWELWGWETWCMIGYHSVPVIYDAYVKGIANYDPDKMLKAMVHSAKLNTLGRPEFAKYGYIPANLELESVTKNLEYCYDDWCIAQFAKAIGNEEIYKEFIERCQYYKNVLDPNGFMHPKANGGFLAHFEPREVNSHYTEANAWQYTTYVPHDLNTYVELMGGKEVAAQLFDSLFYTSSAMTGRDQADISGLMGQYAHGNEPSHHAGYIYSYVGQPWKTQEVVRKIMREFYQPAPDGICGNDDCGQMGAWYVISALGFYPVCPGSNQYVIGSPIFDKATIHLENGKQFVVACENQSEKNIYIRSAKLNGAPYTKSYITYDDIKDGGTLEFVMSSKPNTAWGTADADMPFSRVENTITIMPNVSPSEQAFDKETEIALQLFEPSRKETQATYPAQTDVVYYTLDGSEPTINSAKYSQPFKLTADAHIRAVAFNEKTGYSKPVDAQFFRYLKDRDITILSKASPHYDGGADILIDHIRGGLNFGMGAWQGYEGQNFEAIIDLREVKAIHEVGAGFLQAIGLWIWYPTALAVEISDDNVHYQPYGTYVNKVSPKDETMQIADFVVKKQAKARYVKVIGKSIGKVPSWHIGAGYEGHIFVDEVFVR
ncbi:MAG: GH92 family glycosyl hydrolase [Bacteroidales bacterium]|jgi:predicted alpha-1,2-mannosidase|nr:GH92 family glycosyl hydrolase [Bacteroidales bacterium]